LRPRFGSVTLTRVKVVAIGIGSVIFGIELLRDVFRVPELKGAELWLVDVAREPLARMTALTERLNEAADWDVTVRSVPVMPPKNGMVAEAAQSRAGVRSTRCSASVSPGSAPST